jgi:hypothetical protein
MNRGIAAVCLACALVAGGCEAPDKSPSGGVADPYPPPINDPQVSILAPEIREWLGVQPAIVTDDGQRPMHVEVPVRNMSDRMYLLDYRFLFYDAAGRELQPVMGWTPANFQPKQLLRLSAGALTTDAANWRLEIKWGK